MRSLLLLLPAIVLMCSGCFDTKPPQQQNSKSGNSVTTSQNITPEQPVDLEQEEQKIIDCFEKYKTALVEKNGEKLARCVDQNTRDYYSKILDWVLTAKREEVENLPFMDRLQVLTMRFMVPAEQLRSMDGEKLLIYTIDNEMGGGKLAHRITPGTVTIDGNSGKMGVISYQRDSGMSFDFNKENGEWRMDLTSAFSAAKFALGLALRLSKMTENEFIFTSLKEMPNERQPDDDLWNPIGK